MLSSKCVNRYASTSKIFSCSDPGVLLVLLGDVSLTSRVRGPGRRYTSTLRAAEILASDFTFGGRPAQARYMKRFNVNRILMHRDAKTMPIQTGDYDRDRNELGRFFFLMIPWR